MVTIEEAKAIAKNHWITLFGNLQVPEVLWQGYHDERSNIGLITTFSGRSVKLIAGSVAMILRSLENNLLGKGATSVSLETGPFSGHIVKVGEYLYFIGDDQRISDYLSDEERLRQYLTAEEAKILATNYHIALHGNHSLPTVWHLVYVYDYHGISVASCRLGNILINLAFWDHQHETAGRNLVFGLDRATQVVTLVPGHLVRVEEIIYFVTEDCRVCQYISDFPGNF